MNTFLAARYTYEALRNSKLPIDELRKLQFRRFKRLLKHAYDTVPLYRELYRKSGIRPDSLSGPEDILELPTVSKAMIRGAEEQAISTSYNRSELLRFRTSGSTGIPLTLYFTKWDNMRLSGVGARTFFLNGMSIFDKRMRIVHPSIFQRPPRALSMMNLLRVYNISLFEPVESIVRQIMTIQPDVIEGYSSALDRLSKDASQIGPKIEPKLVVTYSELLERHMRDRIRNSFGTEPIDQYGSHETRTIGWECREHSGYHVNSDSVLLSVVRDGEEVSVGERGRTIVTNMFSYAMPIIRYELGDTVTKADESCQCGLELPLIKNVEGKALDPFVLPDGKEVSAHLLKKTIGLKSGIFQFKIIQQTRYEARVEIVPGKDLQQSTLDAIRSELADLLGLGVEVNVSVVEEIPLPSTGKYKVVESLAR